MRENIKETRLENGLTVLSDSMSEVRSATLGFFFRVGSRNEPDELNGITHFIEHCVFKGGKKRSAREIAVEQDRLGGNLDAFTTHEETGFIIKVTDDRLDAAFDLVTDMLVHPHFDEADLKNEQRVIIEEIKMLDDSPEEVLGDMFHRDFFPGHQLGMAITGTPETVRTFDAATTRMYHRSAFAPRNLVVVAAGNVDHDHLLRLCENLFPHDATNPIEQVAVKPPPTASPFIIKRREDLEQAHLIIATPFINARDPRRYAADLLTNAIGGGTSSRLWQKIREDRGLAYSVGASASMFNDTAFFAISAATSPEQIGEVVELSIAEMRDVAANGISQEELDLMKEQTRASILLSLEDSAARAATLAHAELVHGRQIELEETLANLDAVTTDDLNAVAREFFVTGKIAFAAIGDIDENAVTPEMLLI